MCYLPKGGSLKDQLVQTLKFPDCITAAEKLVAVIAFGVGWL